MSMVDSYIFFSVTVFKFFVVARYEFFLNVRVAHTWITFKHVWIVENPFENESYSGWRSGGR